MEKTNEIKSYNLLRAHQYDEESIFDKGNREQHLSILQDILSYNERLPDYFLELGCGTGFFTSVFFEKYPAVQGILIDGSSSMLEIAKKKYGNKGNIKYNNAALEAINWDVIPELDIVFSALTIHHLSDASKYIVYQNIYKKIKEKGKFIYFDQFKTDSGEKDVLLEYLACKDIQKRLIKAFSLENAVLEELEIEKIIKKDRLVKSLEKDQEALIQDTIYQLEEIGFKMVTIVYQEFRFFSIVAYK